jgi:hypothetical protein
VWRKLHEPFHVGAKGASDIPCQKPEVPSTARIRLLRYMSIELGTGVSASAPDAMGAGSTRGQHPLEVIGSAGKP